MNVWFPTPFKPNFKNVPLLYSDFNCFWQIGVTLWNYKPFEVTSPRTGVDVMTHHKSELRKAHSRLSFSYSKKLTLIDLNGKVGLDSKSIQGVDSIYFKSISAPPVFSGIRQLQCILCTVFYALRSMHCFLCSAQYAQPTMYYVWSLMCAVTTVQILFIIKEQFSNL